MKASPPPARSPLLRPPFVVGALVLLALAVRVPLLAQSLWYDELYTLIHYVWQPWSVVVAGEYSPNNHVLFTICAKAMASLTGEQFAESAIRLPSVLAGAAAGLLLAWPIRRSHPKAALLLSLLGILHPWSVAISGWARGYPLLLCLCTAATLLLMADRHWAYTFTAAAALYTHPIGIAVILGHCVAIVLFKRDRWQRWLLSLALAGVLTALLYLPLLTGAKTYWTRPERPSIDYGQFVVQSLRHVNAGDNLRSVGHVITSLFVLGVGLPLAWRKWPELRAMVVTFGVAGAFATLAPLLIPLSGEVRAMLWLIPLYCLGMFGVLTAVDRLHPAFWLVPLGFFGLRVFALQQTPAHAIREAVAEARKLAGERGHVIGVYMASPEARWYGPLDALAMTVDAPGLPTIGEAEAKLGGTPHAIVFYEEFLRRDEPKLWEYLRKHYRPVRRLPGRIGDVTILVRDAPMAPVSP